MKRHLLIAYYILIFLSIHSFTCASFTEKNPIGNNNISNTLLFEIKHNSTNLRHISNTYTRILDSIESKNIPCVSGNGISCVCPGGCMTIADNTSNYCILKKCWTWDSDETICKGTGPKFTPAIVLQAIPLTGVFGAGFGNMGRWDLFSIGSIIWGVGFLLPCIIVCIMEYNQSTDNAIHVIFTCYGYILSIAITSYYIWGIVTIANKDILGPNGCPFVD